MSTLGNGTWDFNNQIRDLSDVLSTIIANSPTFIGKFPERAIAYNPKHEWLEDVLKPRTVAYSAYNQSTGVATVATGAEAGWAVGDYVRFSGDSAIFKITTIASGAITVAFVASNGSTTDAIGDIATSAGTLIFDHRPIEQGSTAGETMFGQSGTEYNYTEIVRGDITLTRTALNTKIYGNENSMDVQYERALIEMTRRMNRIALFGVRSGAPANSTPSSAGGLYYFGTQTGGLSVGASGAALGFKLINDGAQAILDAGGNPDMIVCGPGQRRVLSQLQRSQITLQPGETRRGSYADAIVSESTGAIMEIVTEPSLSAMDSDVWVIDSTSLGISYLEGSKLLNTDSTQQGHDGIRRTLISELTFEFKNAKQKLCRISGLQASASSLT